MVADDEPCHGEPGGDTGARDADACSWGVSFAPCAVNSDHRLTGMMVSGNVRRDILPPPRLPRGTGESLSWTGDAFVEACDEMIRRVGAIYRLRTHDLDDFVQDAWLTVLSGLSQGRYDPCRGRLADWLYIVARNRAVSYFRQRCARKTGGRNCRWSAWRRPCRRIQRGCWIAIVTCKRCARAGSTPATCFPDSFCRVLPAADPTVQCERSGGNDAADAPTGTRLRSSCAAQAGIDSVATRWGLTPWGGKGSGPESREGWIEAVHAET